MARKLKLVDATTIAQEEQPLQQPIKQTGHKLRIRQNKTQENLPPRPEVLQDDTGGRRSVGQSKERLEQKRLDIDKLIENIHGLGERSQQLVNAFVRTLPENGGSEKSSEATIIVAERLKSFSLAAPGRQFSISSQNTKLMREISESFDAVRSSDTLQLCKNSRTDTIEIVQTSQGPFPRHWRNRPNGWKDPVKFIKIVYENEISTNSLVRSQLSHLDYDLSVAYASWIRPQRHPEDRFLPEVPQPRVPDEEKRQRKLARNARSQARFRERRKML